MLRGIMSEVDVVKGLRAVQERLQLACNKRPVEFHKYTPRLVAVSKTKAKEVILATYAAGQRNFGENYVQELVDKSHDTEVLELCPEIRWHYIGHLQRNKVNKVVCVPGLYMVETVDSDKLASTLSTAWLKSGDPGRRLKVMAQVNTSGEAEKNGCQPDRVVDLARHIVDSCPGLLLAGVMTIGQFGYDAELGPNPDFICLRQVRDRVCAALGLESLEISMGMSDDFQHAVEMGSTNVRVGSSIFGYREPKPKAEVASIV